MDIRPEPLTDRPLRVVLYCRVSSEEQVRGYSLNQQEEALREHAASQGLEVLEVVRDEGYSGAYLERPGLDEVRDLVEAGAASWVVSQDADRITRDLGHRMLLDEEFDKRGCKLEALDDWGDNTHEGQLLRFLKGWVSKGERLKIAERTRRAAGRRRSRVYWSPLRSWPTALCPTPSAMATSWTRGRCRWCGGRSR